jgi:hypothetical protein
MRLVCTDDDVADGGSDRLVDAMVVARGATGSPAGSGRHDADADQVRLQVLPADLSTVPVQDWFDLSHLLPGRTARPSKQQRHYKSTGREVVGPAVRRASRTAWWRDVVRASLHRGGHDSPVR